MIVEIHPIVNCCKQFRFGCEHVPVVVFMFEARPQRFGAGVVPTDTGGAHRAAQPMQSTGQRQIVRGVLAAAIRVKPDPA
jgi:hypothetical protein